MTQRRNLVSTAELTSSKIEELLGDDAALLTHTSSTISASDLHLPGPDFVDRVYSITDRNPQVLRNLQALFSHGRLAGSGYVSILPVDQGIEHSAGASFAAIAVFAALSGKVCSVAIDVS